MRRRCVRRRYGKYGKYGKKAAYLILGRERSRSACSELWRSRESTTKTDDAGKATKYAGWHYNWQRQVGMSLSGIQLGTEMIAFLTRVAIPLASEVKSPNEFKRVQ